MNSAITSEGVDELPVKEKACDPTVEFSATPEAPSDETVSRLKYVVSWADP
jgi:hypothetical protein